MGLKKEIRDAKHRLKDGWRFLTGFRLNDDGIIKRGLSDTTERKRANRKPKDGVWTEDVTIDWETNTWVRLFYPVAASITILTSGRRCPVVLYYHGGGFCLMSADHKRYDRFCRRIAKEFEVIVVSVNYRRAPEHKCPAAYDDSFKALLWLTERSTPFLKAYADLGNCFLMGDDAGGNIVHHMGLRAAEDAAEMRPLSIRGLIMLQPFFGGDERTWSECAFANDPSLTLAASDKFWRAFLGEEAHRDHPVCNILRPLVFGEDITKIRLPDIFIAVARDDILQVRQRSYVKRMRKQGKEVTKWEYRGVGHCFFLLKDSDKEPQVTKQTTQLLQDVKNFIVSHTV